MSLLNWSSCSKFNCGGEEEEEEGRTGGREEARFDKGPGNVSPFSNSSGVVEKLGRRGLFATTGGFKGEFEMMGILRAYWLVVCGRAVEAGRGGQTMSGVRELSTGAADADRQ